MSKEKTTIEKIKSLLFGEERPIVDEVVAQKFMDANLEDGTLIQIEPALELKAAVVIIKEDGEVIAAPDDVHTLADGTKIRTEAGVIKEIIEVEAEEVIEEEVEVPMAQEPQADKVKKVVESIIKESHFATQEDLSKGNEEVKSEIAKMKTELKEEIMNSVFEAFKAFSEEPTTDPVVKSKENKFKKAPRKSWADNFKK
jgi:hypothetical protein